MHLPSNVNSAAAELFLFCITYFIFTSFLCEFETWTRKLKKEHRLKVFKNKVLRKTFACKMGQVNKGIEKATHSSPNIIRVINQEE